MFTINWKQIQVSITSLKSVPKPRRFDEEDSPDDETWIAGVSAVVDQESEDSTEEYMYSDLDSEGEEEDNEDEDGLKAVSSSLETMTISRPTQADYFIRFQHPFLIYNYMDEKQRKVTIDLCVPSFPIENFHIRFNAESTDVLISTKMPDFCHAKSVEDE